MNTKITTYSAAIGALIRLVRTQKQIEQSEIAEKMGISQASYSRIEAGKANVTVDHMFQAADALGLTKEQLFQAISKYLQDLENNGVKAIPAQRGNSKGAENKPDSGAGKMVLGAALGALAVSLFSNK